ncbi:hypothetical protein Syun_002460 [Stephania yunnanensis]|uniref:Uncharacterized protein n=1 Tax=Stephania yunnanensis TaxID=152371 RepID=A0AAP0Q7G0_9MAGN
MADITREDDDDGELWLPSELTYMEELAQQLSAYALLERAAQHPNISKPPIDFAPNFEVRHHQQQQQQHHHHHHHHHQSRFRSSVAPAMPGLGVNGGRAGNHSLYSSGYAGFRVGLRPLYQYCPVKPPRVQRFWVRFVVFGLVLVTWAVSVKGVFWFGVSFNGYLRFCVSLKVERMAHARAVRGVVQRQSQQNRFLPFRGNGGFVRRESGGTGVFFPRVALAALPTDDPVKQSLRSGEEHRQRQGVKRIGVVGREEVVGLPNSPEMALPKDWTY